MDANNASEWHPGYAGVVFKLRGDPIPSSESGIRTGTGARSPDVKRAGLLLTSAPSHISKMALPIFK